MKYIFTLFLFIPILSCNKDEQSSKAASTDPTVKSVTFYPVFSGGAGNGLGADVEIEVPEDGSVTKLEMQPATGKNSAGPIANPKSGKHTLYHLTSAYPRGNMYQFIFTLKDNSQIKSKEYKVGN